MIRSFRCKETERLFKRERVGRLPATLQKSALRKLLILDQAKVLNDLRVPPGNHLKPLVEDRRGQYSIRINDQWRICFEWNDDNNAENVEIVDYH